MSTEGRISRHTAELALLALREVLIAAAPRRNGLPVPAAVHRAVAELRAASSANGTTLDGAAAAVRAYESTAEAARRLGISERAVRKRCARGTLPARRMGRTWLVERGPTDA